MLISIIIPTYNEEKHIETLLSSITSKAYQNIEIIVVDGGSKDRTIELVEQFMQVKLVYSSKGRAIQLNNGAANSKGNVLFFLHADSQLPHHWKAKIMAALVDPSCLAGTFYLKFDQSGFWYRVYSYFSKLNYTFFTYGDQGLFIRKEAFEHIGCYPLVPIMEDYEMIKNIKKIGALTKLNAPIITSARKFTKNGVLLQQLKNIAIVLLYQFGLAPEKLAKWYNR